MQNIVKQLSFILILCFLSFLTSAAVAEEDTETAPTQKTFEFAGWSLTASTIIPGLSADGKDIVLSATGTPLTIRKSKEGSGSGVVATASKGEFNNQTQTMTLSGRPTLKQGLSRMIATDDATTIQITFGENFKFSIKGPHRMELAR